MVLGFFRVILLSTIVSGSIRAVAAVVLYICTKSSLLNHLVSPSRPP